MNLWTTIISVAFMTQPAKWNSLWPPLIRHFFHFPLLLKEKFFDYPHIDVATINDGVVAFSAYTDDELAWLYVSPDMMRNGIGRKLVARALDIEPGIKHIEALYGNEPARKLYESIVFFVQEIEEESCQGTNCIM